MGLGDIAHILVVLKRTLTMGITNIIAKQSKKIANKYAKLPGRIKKAEINKRTDAVDDFEKQKIDLVKDKSMLEFINSTDKEKLKDTLKDTLKEKKELMKNYAYAARARNSVRGDLFKSSKASTKTQARITKREDESARLAELKPKESAKFPNLAKLRNLILRERQKDIDERKTSNKEKKEQLAQEKLYHDDRKTDANNNYNFFNKIIEVAGKEPAEIKKLKKKTKQLNAAIKKQTKMHAKSEHSAIAALTAKHKLNRETPQTERSKLNFETKFRRSEDFKSHYEFSRNIINRYGQTETGETKELKKQFKDLDKAIKEQNGYRKNLEAGEKRKLKNNEKIEKLDAATSKLTTANISDNKTLEKLYQQRRTLANESLKIDRNNKDAASLHDFTKTLIENASLKGDASELPKQFAALKVASKEQTNYRKTLEKTQTEKLKTSFSLEAINKKIEGIPVSKNGKATDPKKQGQLDNLQKKQKQLNLEAIKQDRQITDATQLHEFSRTLIDNAKNAQPADPSVLPQQFAALKVAAKRQERYRDKLEGIETKLAKAEADKGKLSVKNEKRNNSKIEQLTRQQSDAKQAHEMMNELIDQAAENGSALDLPTQCKQLREGIGGKRKFTRRPFGQERNRLNLEEAQNKQLDNKLKLDKNTTELKTLQQKQPKSTADIKKLGELTVKNENLVLANTQRLDRIANAKIDHEIGNSFLQLARDTKDPSKLKAQFDDLKAKVKERDKFTTALEKEKNRQLKNSNKILSAESKLNVEKSKLDTLTDTNTTKFVKQQSKVDNQQWELDKCNRRKNENTIRDARRLENTLKFNTEANRLMKEIYNPKTSKIEREQARKDFDKLKQDAKNAKKLEKQLEPRFALKARAGYRGNLEKAEKDELDLNKKIGLFALERAAANNIPDKDKREKALAKCDRKQKALSRQTAEIERRTNDSKLIYKLSDKLLQKRQQEDPLSDVKDFKQQFKELKAVDKFLREQQSNRNPSAPEMRELIQEQLDSPKPDTAQLAKDCKNLREALGGTRRFTRRTFGQERNFKKLQKAEATNKKYPNEHNERRVVDAKSDVALGQQLIDKAMTLQGTERSKALEKLKAQFKALKTAIKERNKFAKNIEKLEKQSKKSEKRDAKAITRAEKKNASIERKQLRAKRRLDRRQERLGKLDPNDKNLAEKQKKLQARVDRQQGRMGKLEDRLKNQEAKIADLKVQQTENTEAYEKRIDKAINRHDEANNKLRELVDRGETDKKEAKNAFTTLREEIKADLRTENERKNKQKIDSKERLQNTADKIATGRTLKEIAANKPKPAPAPEPPPVAPSAVPAPPAPAPGPAQPQPIVQPAPVQPEPAPAPAPAAAPVPPVQPGPEPAVQPRPVPPPPLPPAPPAPIPQPRPKKPAYVLEDNDIVVERSNLLPSETAKTQAIGAAKEVAQKMFPPCTLEDKGAKGHSIQQEGQRKPIGIIEFETNEDGTKTMRAIPEKGNDSRQNEAFFKIAATIAARMTPPNPKVDIEPIITVGKDVKDGDKQKIKDTFKQANTEHKERNKKGNFKKLRDDAQRPAQPPTQPDQSPRTRSASHPS